MEQVTQAVNDELVASLDYKLATGNTNYIQSRKSVQYFPSSLSTFTPTTSRVCRIPITSGMDFVDPESVKLAFTFRNTDGTSDMLCGSPDPSCFIERIQLFANGQRVEDISYYGRSAFMYSLLKPLEWWQGRLWEGLPVDAGGWAQPVQPGQKRDVLMAPHLIGMFNCGKMLPPQLNLVLEIEFAEPAMAMRAGVGSSLSYQIENVHFWPTRSPWTARCGSPSSAYSCRTGPWSSASRACTCSSPRSRRAPRATTSRWPALSRSS